MSFYRCLFFLYALGNFLTKKVWFRRMFLRGSCCFANFLAEEQEDILVYIGSAWFCCVQSMMNRGYLCHGSRFCSSCCRIGREKLGLLYITFHWRTPRSTSLNSRYFILFSLVSFPLDLRPKENDQFWALRVSLSFPNGRIKTGLFSTMLFFRLNTLREFLERSIWSMSSEDMKELEIHGALYATVFPHPQWWKKLPEFLKCRIWSMSSEDMKELEILGAL